MWLTMSGRGGITVDERSTRAHSDRCKKADATEEAGFEESLCVVAQFAEPTRFRVTSGSHELNRRAKATFGSADQPRRAISSSAGARSIAIDSGNTYNGSLAVGHATHSRECR